MPKNVLSIPESVDEELSYDPDTGHLTWKSRRSGVRFGGKAGRINSDGYVVIQFRGVEYLAHRVALQLAGFDLNAEDQVDHINHVRSDNRLANLRITNSTGNARNRSKSSRNKSGYTGVVWHKGGGLWQAHARVSGVTTRRAFKNIEDAIEWRVSMLAGTDYHENHGKVVCL